MFRTPAALLLAGLLAFASAASAQSEGSAAARLQQIEQQVQTARALAISGHNADAQSLILRAYLDGFEPLEALYGAGSSTPNSPLASEITAGETAFHIALQNADPRTLPGSIAVVGARLVRIRAVLPGAPVQSRAAVAVTGAATATTVDPASAATPEIRGVLQQLQASVIAYRKHDAARALDIVEHTYLEQFEPLESRLPRALVDRVEKGIHLQLRPAIRSNADPAVITALSAQIGRDLLEGDRFLARGGNTWFTIVNSFVIIIREGLEAVLLIAALLAYLAAVGADRKYRRQIYAGMGAGVVASIATWFAASTLLPISGANRELLEGVTALLAVAVLLYVAHWLFQKTYIHDWKEYLREQMSGAVHNGSAFAMAALAFAAVYREGFETVLFYQALAFDSGVTAVLGGFIPGALVITLVGFAIIRAGVKLPLKKVFAGTNALLLYLAFVFIGKGLYSLQEAGVFSPHPLPLPDHPALRQLLGFYPLVETIVAQLVFVLLLTGTYAAYRLKRARAPQSVPLPEPRGVARQA